MRSPVVFLTLEIVATLLLLGTQVSAEYELIATEVRATAPQPLWT